MKLYLHIGSHKAGSTSIQAFLEDNQAALTERGYYIDDDLTFRDHWQLAAWAGYPDNADYFINTLQAFHDNALKQFIDQFEVTLLQKLEDAKKDGRFHSMVISSESLYSQCLNERAIARLAATLTPHFSSVSVLFYFRDQVAMAKSVYAQLIHGPAMGKQSYPDFVDTVQAESEFDYAYQLDTWAAYFGDDNIHIAEIGRKPGALKGEGLIHHFVSSLALSFSPDEFSIRGKASNRSSDYNNIRLIRRLNQCCSNKFINLSYNSLWVRGWRWLIKRLPVKGHYPEHFDEQIAARFRSGNARMKAKFGSGGQSQ